MAIFADLGKMLVAWKLCEEKASATPSEMVCLPIFFSFYVLCVYYFSFLSGLKQANFVSKISQQLREIGSSYSSTGK